LDRLALIYGLPMMSGAAKMRPLDNDRFPQVRPRHVREMLAPAIAPVSSQRRAS
jgi:hypothetical protein